MNRLHPLFSDILARHGILPPDAPVRTDPSAVPPKVGYATTRTGIRIGCAYVAPPAALPELSPEGAVLQRALLPDALDRE